MKNRIAKLLSLSIATIILATCLGTVPVFAAEDIPHVISATTQTDIEAEAYSTVKSKNMKGYFRDYNSGGRYPNKGAQNVASTASGSFTYYIDVPETGIYEFAIYYTGGGNTAWSYTVDGTKIGQAECHSSNQDINKYFIANLELTKGRHYVGIDLLLRDILGQYCFFYYLSFKPVSSGGGFVKDSGSFKDTQIPCIIQGEDFDLGTAGSYRAGEAMKSEYRADSKMAIEKVDNGSFYLLLSEGDYANYTFMSNVSDMYTIAVNAKGDAHFTLFLDGKELPVSGRAKEELEFVDVKLSTAYIEAGNHTLQVKSDKEVGIDFIRIYSGKDIADTNVIIEENDVGTLNNVYKTFYVSTAGNDETGDGSKVAPFATIGRAKKEVAKYNNEMTGDIVVYVQPGEYKLTETETFTPEYGGKNGYNVIFKGTDILNPPMISGGKRVTGWTEGENGIWSAPLSGVEYVRNLYVNEFAAIRARSTYRYQMTEYYDDPATEDIQYDGYKIRRLNLPESFENIFDMELVWNRAWETRRTPIQDIIWRDKEVIIKVFPDAIKDNADTTKPGQYAYFENAMELLNEPGEFYWNSKEERIYYYPYEQEDMTTAVTYVGETEKLIKVEGNSADDKVENLIFDNFKIFYGAWNFLSKYGWMGCQSDGIGTGSRMTGTYADQVAAQIEVDYADRFVLKNCEIACHGSLGLDMETGVTNSKIEGNIFRDLSGTGIKIGNIGNNLGTNKHKQCRKIDIVNNVITRIGQENFNNVGLSVYWEKDINILHNYIKDTPYSGMSIGWGWEQEYQHDVGNYNVSYNHVENVMQTNNDGGGIYTLGKLGGSKITNNYVRGHVRTAHGGLIYHDAGSGNVEDFNNVLLDSHYALHITPEKYKPKNIYFHDNYTNAPENAGKQANNYAADRMMKIEEPIKVNADNLPEEAQAIVDAAGLEPQYKRLQAMAEMPSWHDDRHYGALMYEFESRLDEEPGIAIEAEDFIKGGEGVAYHHVIEYDKANDYRDDVREIELMKFADLGSYVIGTNGPGQWHKYKFTIPVEGDYLVSVKGAQWWSSDPSVNVAKLYLNGELLDMEFIMEKKSGGVERWQEITYPEPIHLAAGKYELKMEFVSSFYFDKIRFLNVDEEAIVKFYGNEAHYDESEFVTYENYKSSREKQKIRDAQKKDDE